MNTKGNNCRFVSIGIIFTLLLASEVLAATVTIDFESSSNPRAVSGTVATNLYADLGIVFASVPTIQRDSIPSSRSQVLQQGRVRGGSSTGGGVVLCAPLEMEFNSSLGVREARMRMINRHLRYYSVRAFSGAVEVDKYEFWPPSPPPFSPIELYRDITLRATDGEGDITRIVADPPADCFDLLRMDNLILETLREPSPTNIVWPLSYEVNQGVMSRLTKVLDSSRVSRPDTRLMALPSKRLTFINGRDTGVRFFLGASESEIPNYDASLRVDITYADGTRRTKTITENTEGSAGVRSSQEPLIPQTSVSLEENTLRRILVKRRARVDQSLDFVIPGQSLQNAQKADLQLLSPDGLQLARIRVDFEGPYTMGINFLRVTGIGMDSAVGTSPALEPTRSFIKQYMEDMMPVSGLINFQNFGILTMNTGATNCNAFLTALGAAFVGTGATSAISGVNYWTNMYVAQRPPGCGGLGLYNTPGALTNTNISTAAHEVGHNIGINHATTQHGESAGGAGDNEPWPYIHGSIGALDEAQNFDYGVFGLVMNLNAATTGVDLLENWGTWTFGPVAPCRATTDSILFPTCTARDAQIAHDFMSYGPGGPLAVWGRFGNFKWISDINYHRVTRWLQECRQLDPPHRFMTGGTINIVDSTGECNSARGADGVVGAPSPSDGAGASLVDGLVFSGIITKEGAVKSFRVIRKPVVRSALTNEPGEYKLIQRAKTKEIIRTIPFRVRVAAVHDAGPNQSFVIVAPYDEKLANAEITHQKKSIFKQSSSASRPTVELVSPKGGEVWREGSKRIAWHASDVDGDKVQVFIQYSIDVGRTWFPLAMLDENTGELNVQVEDLAPTKKAMIYISVSDGLNTFFTQSPKTFTVGKYSVVQPQPLSFKEDCLQHDIQELEVKQVGGRWKIVQGNRLLFDFQNKALEAKSSLAAIKRFGFDQTCYIGRPQPSMTYLKKGKIIPNGPSAGLDCIEFDSTSVDIRREGSQWLLYSNQSRIAMFPSEKEARQALEAIKYYGLNRHCFVGRPNPSFNYWLSSSGNPLVVGDGAACSNQIQGKIAWDYKGTKQWSTNNVKRLCRGAENSIEPSICFQRVMHDGVNWGGGTRWKWQNALDLCEGSQNASETIRCFEQEIGKGSSWQQAIRICGR